MRTAHLLDFIVVMDHKQSTVSIGANSLGPTAVIKRTDIKQLESSLHTPEDPATCSNENHNNLDKLDFQTPLPPPPPKVTVSLPKHAASRLRALAQKRDIALVKLGILSIQFENDQIIPLHTIESGDSKPLSKPKTLTTMLETAATTTTTTTTTSTTIAIRNQDQVEKQLHSDSDNLEDDETITKDMKFPSVRDQLTSVDESIQDLNASITTYSSFNSPSELMMPNDDLNLDAPGLSVTGSPIMDSSMNVATTLASTMPSSKNNSNSSKLTVPYDDDEDDNDDVKEDDDAAANDVELFSRGSAQLTQLEFSDPIELEMYESDNLLFPDYTLNLS